MRNQRVERCSSCKLLLNSVTVRTFRRERLRVALIGLKIGIMIVEALTTDKSEKKKGVMFMKEELTNKVYHIAVPFLVGGVVGAGLTLLLAPKSGKEVREDIKRFTHDSKERVSLAIDKGKELYKDSIDRAALAIDKGKEIYKDSIERAALAIDKGKDIYEGGRTIVGKAMDAGKTAFVEEKEKWQHT